MPSSSAVALAWASSAPARSASSPAEQRLRPLVARAREHAAGAEALVHLRRRAVLGIGRPQVTNGGRQPGGEVRDGAVHADGVEHDLGRVRARASS